MPTHENETIQLIVSENLRQQALGNADDAIAAVDRIGTLAVEMRTKKMVTLLLEVMYHYMILPREPETNPELDLFAAMCMKYLTRLFNVADRDDDKVIVPLVVDWLGKPIHWKNLTTWSTKFIGVPRDVNYPSDNSDITVVVDDFYCILLECKASLFIKAIFEHPLLVTHFINAFLATEETQFIPYAFPKLCTGLPRYDDEMGAGLTPKLVSLFQEVIGGTKRDVAQICLHHLYLIRKYAEEDDLASNGVGDMFGVILFFAKEDTLLEEHLVVEGIPCIVVEHILLMDPLNRQCVRILWGLRLISNAMHHSSLYIAQALKAGFLQLIVFLQPALLEETAAQSSLIEMLQKLLSMIYYHLHNYTILRLTNKALDKIAEKERRRQSRHGLAPVLAGTPCRTHWRLLVKTATELARYKTLVHPALLHPCSNTNVGFSS